MLFLILCIIFFFIACKYFKKGKNLKGYLLFILVFLFFILDFIPLGIWYEAPECGNRYELSPIAEIMGMSYYCIFDAKTNQYTYYNGIIEKKFTFPKQCINIKEVTESNIPYVQEKTIIPRWFASKLLCFANIGKINIIELTIPKNSILYT